MIIEANKVQEKIYLFKNPITEEPNDMWLSNRSCDDDIEYTRTDAFIEKACEYMRNHIDKQLTIYHEQTRKKRDDFIKDFKKYMKGK